MKTLSYYLILLTIGMIMKKNIFIVLIASIGLATYAQTTVKGHVINGQGAGVG